MNLGAKRQRIVVTHHVGKRQQRRLHLRHVPVLKQVVGFEDVVGLQAVGDDGADEVGQVLHLQRKRVIQRECGSNYWSSHATIPKAPSALLHSSDTAATGEARLGKSAV